MLKVTDELLTKARNIVDAGVTKNVVETMYREQGLSMRRMSQSLSVDLDMAISLKDVNALLEYFEIPKLTDHEQRQLAKKRPVNLENVIKKEKEIESLGFSKSVVTKMYDEGLSKNEIIERINSIAGSTVVHKTWLKKLFSMWKIEERSANEMYALRIKKMEREAPERMKSNTYGKGLTSKEIIDLYESGASLAQIYRDTGVSPQSTAKILRNENITIRGGYRYQNVIEELKQKGFGLSEIENFYISKNQNNEELSKWMGEILGYSISTTSSLRILRMLEITKPVELIKFQQGASSRIELARNLEKLRRAGFESVNDLATYYDANKSITKRALLEQLNRNLNEDDYPFTERWLGRHMDPLLPEDRLKGTSRIEKEFAFEFSNLLDVDEEIVLGSFSIISPYQLDVYLPNLNLAVEFNGDYWHSDRFMLENHGMTARAYHEMKLARCEELGIRLLFVWESDWLGNRDEILSALEEVLSNPASEPEILSILSLDELFEDELAA